MAFQQFQSYVENKIALTEEMKMENAVTEKKLSLKELVEYARSLDQTDPDCPQDILELGELAGQLLKGKIDDAARFRAGLKAHIEALDAQRDYAEKMLQRTEELMEEAVGLSGKTKLEGSAWTIAMQKSGGKLPVIIDDPSKLPDSCKKISLTIHEPYTPELHRFYKQVLLKREDVDSLLPEDVQRLEKIISIEPSKTLIAIELEKNPNTPGAHLGERGMYLKVTPGKVKPKQIEG